MPFNPIKFLDIYGIQWTQEGSDSSPEFVNISCPFCGDEKEHGGFSLFDNYYHCWICKFHPLDKVIQVLTNCEYWESKKIIEEFSEDDIRYSIIKQKKKKPPRSLNLPAGAGELSRRHRKYLEKRDFNPDLIIDQYGVKGTDYKGAYSHRIIAPIFFNDRLVSYQGRDITNKAKLRYKVCAKDKELIHHKFLLYNIDKAVKKRVLVVEGIFDVWRFGAGCVGTFGTSVLKEQIYLLSKFDTVFILFDKEAGESAEKVALSLSGLNTQVEIIQLQESNDPAELSPKDANHLKKELNL